MGLDPRPRTPYSTYQESPPASAGRATGASMRELSLSPPPELNSGFRRSSLVSHAPAVGESDLLEWLARDRAEAAQRITDWNDRECFGICRQAEDLLHFLLIQQMPRR